MQNPKPAFNRNIIGLRNLKFGHAAYYGSNYIDNLNNKDYIKKARELGKLVLIHHSNWTLEKVLEEGCKDSESQKYHPRVQKYIEKMMKDGYVMMEC